jgi:LPS O-antigen subunit length determinant protein (WzzB/FepE family)
MKVLHDYFEIKETKKEISTSVNQQIYGEIRNLMDTGAKSFRMEQERAQYIEKMNKQRVEALKIANNKKIAKEIVSETSETSETE